MDISIIISTWNNYQRLELTLGAISRCVLPKGLNWEIILVNNNCTDDTPRIMERFKSRLPLICIDEPVQGLSRAKNTGLNAAKGKWVIFTDDDVQPCPDWIVIYWDSFLQYEGKTFFGGPVVSEFERVPDLRLIKLAPYSVKGFHQGNHLKYLYEKNFISANWACERQALLQMGGFDTSRGLNPDSKKLVTGEEVELMERLKKSGWKALYLPLAGIKHFVPTSKCTISHIASRVEAFSMQKIISFCHGHKRRLLLEIPMIITTLSKSIARLCVDAMHGQKESPGYVQWRRGIGYLKGVKACLAGK